MRIAYNLLAITTVAVFILAGAFWVSGAFLARDEHAVPASRETVYVDVGRLATLHPDSELLADMKSVVSEIRAGSAWKPAPAKVDLTPPPAPRMPIDHSMMSRAKLEAELAQEAVSALGKLETDQRDALQARLRASRALLVSSADAEIAAEVREIEDEAASKLRSLAQRYAADRINAQLKISALGVARGGMKDLSNPGSRGDDGGAAALVRETETSGNSELASIDSQLRGVQADLGHIIGVSMAETEQIQADARKRIETLKTAAHQKIDSTLAIQEDAESRKIENSITMARSDILEEMTTVGQSRAYSGSPRSPGTARVALSVHASPASVGGVGGDLGSIEGAVASLEIRIRDEVRGAVLKLAESKGVSVVFIRNGRRVPDQTDEFAQAFRDRGWELCAPVLCSEPG